MTDLVTLAQAQAFVGDSSSGSAAWLQGCIDAASAAVIEIIGVDPSTQSRTEYSNGTNTMSIYPRAAGKSAPISAVGSVTINQALTVDSCVVPFNNIIAPTIVDLTQVAFDDLSIFYTNGYIFPRGKKNISLTYTSGYALTTTAGLPTLPAAIMQATLYTVQGFFTALGKELNATGESFSGVLSQSFYAGGPGAVPPAAQLMLKPYQTKMFMP